MALFSRHYQEHNDNPFLEDNPEIIEDPDEDAPEVPEGEPELPEDVEPENPQPVDVGVIRRGLRGVRNALGMGYVMGNGVRTGHYKSNLKRTVSRDNLRISRFHMR